jgi:glycosyltransferase involved in cell wall biosynthesis
MNILFLNAWDSSGGAARAALRLLNGLKERGINAQMLVKKKTCTDLSIIGPNTKLDKGMAFLRSSLEHRLINRYPGWNGFTFSPALFPDRLLHQVTALAPDIIHLHWMGDGFLKVETLPGFKRPLVWTLHDSWPFTGGCHIPFDCTRYRQSCGECPALGSDRENDLSYRVFRRKQKAWQGLNPIIVSPSHWLAECARSSSLFRDARIEVIANGIDIRKFRPVTKSVAREALGLPDNRKLILFGGMHSTSDRNKGFHLLLPALHALAANRREVEAELLVFGSPEPEDPPDFGLKTHYLGWLGDDISLALVYAAADVFVLPSTQENLPNTIMEAMACGTPCVAFHQGGVPDLIDHEQNGYLAQPFEPTDLARGIAWVLENDGRRNELATQARRKIEKTFALENVAGRYVALYRELLGHE